MRFCGRWLSAFVPALLAASIVGPKPVTAEPTSTGRAIVGFERGRLPSVFPGEILSGLTVLDRVVKGPFLVLAATDLDAVRKAFREVPDVAWVEDDTILEALTIPDDPRYETQYGPGMMGFPDAWDDAGFGSADVTVAVLDAGIRRSHEDFQPSRVLRGRDYVNDDDDPNDDCGHGTHVAGTVAATTDNARGVAGMSQATLLPMKVLSPVGLFLTLNCSGSTSDIAEAILDAVDQGAKVISMSLGARSGSNALRNAVDEAWNSGVLVVAAAGNDGPCTNCVSYPAKYPNAIAVSAVGSDKSRASYSSSGPEIEVAAPGTGIWSTYNDGGYRSSSGTSMAVPHVSGALALGLSCSPGTSAAALRWLLQQTVEDRGASGRDIEYGHGLVRIDTLVDALGGCIGGGGGPGNGVPVAAFSAATSGLDVVVDATASHDPDGDALTFTWDFGDGSGGTGVMASHAYPASGSYRIRLVVSDGNGGASAADEMVSVSDGATPPDPDPSTPNLENGRPQSVTLAGSGAEKHLKIFVPAGSNALEIVTDGPACGLLSCSFDADLYVRFGSRATDTAWDCRPFRSGSSERCSFARPAEGWWYVRLKSYWGSGSLSLTGTVSK